MCPSDYSSANVPSVLDKPAGMLGTIPLTEMEVEETPPHRRLGIVRSNRVFLRRTQAKIKNAAKTNLSKRTERPFRT